MVCAIQQFWLVLLSHQKVVITQTAVLGAFCCKGTFIAHLLIFRNPDTHIESSATSFPLMKYVGPKSMRSWAHRAVGQHRLFLGTLDACQWHITLFAEHCHGLKITEPWVWIIQVRRDLSRSPPSQHRLIQELKTKCFIQTRERWTVSGTGSQQPVFN